MSDLRLQSIIEQAFDDRATINSQTQGDIRQAVDKALAMLDAGELRVAEKASGKAGAESWTVNQWLKKAVLLSFRLNDSAPIPGGPGGAHWYDKVESKFADWSANRFAAAGFRAVPGAIVRHSAFI